MRRLAAVLLLAAAPAWADITLTGEQHIGDGESPSFVPRDPVRRAEMRANPTHFWLSQDATVTAVRLDSATSLDGQLQVFVDDMNTPLAGTLSGSTYTLTTPLTLAAGEHSIWPDGGCSSGGFADPCTGGENDFDFDSITLVSAQTTISVNFSRRRHLGDTNDSDNDYTAGWYPDNAEATTLSLTFTLTGPRVLTQARFYRLREIEAAPASFASVILDRLTPGQVTLGELDANAATFTLGSGVTLAAGVHTLTVTAGEAAGNDDDDISWDDLVLVLAVPAGGAPGQYNAVDPAADAVSGPLTTKTAGTPFDVDLVALDNGTLLASYAGTVSVELVNAASGTCTSYAQLASLGSVTFAALDAGRKTVTITHGDAVANARLRINDTANAVTSCSTDNFAIKPAGFGGITVSHGDAATPGTAATLATSGLSTATQPVHKAGRYFTVQAYARTSSGAVTTGYAGSPSLNAGATIAGLGAVLGSASASGWTYPAAGYLRSDSAQYTEAGAVTLELVDTTFADVDADDTDPAVRQVGPTPFSVGRFVPDHFTFVEVNAAEFDAGCASFTYVGQPFNFGTAPTARVTAVSASGAPTRNYTDAGLYKVTLAGPGTLPDSTYAATAGTFNAALVPSPDNTFVNEGNGASLFTLIRPNPGYAFTRGAPAAPFAAEVTITPAFADTDGVTFAAATPGRFGDPAAGGIPFAGGASEVRYGRLVVASAQGSELHPLQVPLQTEYVTSAGSGFARNLADGCTALATADLQLDAGSSIVGLPDPPGNTSMQSVTDPGAGGGLWMLNLSAPGDPGQVTVTANIAASFPWLLTDTDADGAYDDNPSGLATFGLSAGDDRRIFTREVIGF